MQTKTIVVKVLRRQNSDYLFAVSDDLPGLVVPGASEDELAERIPAAITEIFEAQGFRVISVRTTREESGVPETFNAPAFIAAAQLENALA